MANLVFSILCLISVQLSAYIPSSRMILDRTTENSIRTPLYVDQDVTLTSRDHSVVLKEQWLFENENSIRLIVKGEKDLKDQIVFQNLFTEGQKTSTMTGILQSHKQPRGLLEKVLFIRNAEALMKFLVQQGVLRDDVFKSQVFKKMPGSSGFQYQPEPFVRLGRLGGSISYIFGPSLGTDISSPGFWIEQDLFEIKKIRNKDGEELRIDKPSTFSKGARWPKELVYSWIGVQGACQGQARINKVRLADSQQRQIFQKNTERRTVEFDQSKSRALVEEFYQRFR